MITQNQNQNQNHLNENIILLPNIKKLNNDLKVKQTLVSSSNKDKDKDPTIFSIDYICGFLHGFFIGITPFYIFLFLNKHKIKILDKY